MFLFASPMFLTQSPEFVGERVLTKFWELTPPFRRYCGRLWFRLLSRRSVDSKMNRVDESLLSYVSRIFQVYSVSTRILVILGVMRVI
ncbi:unnamed protein product [Brassica napus]|uniref:(rape) hypothetical protein n=1 Tax=Brassica napus TaxID=3708 RepID=A0A816IK74_BRANA|nr:unnamed protein product [Brassica napus]